MLLQKKQKNKKHKRSKGKQRKNNAFIEKCAVCDSKKSMLIGK